ncbi:MAG: LytTR family DNA-binding domain-containing protein, partial [Caulobacteraceae bacterium]
YLAIAALLALGAFVNVATQLDDARRRGLSAPVWRPLTLEATSVLATLAVCGLALVAVRLAPPGRPPHWRTALVHAATSVVYSSLHVGLMTGLRLVVASATGWRLRLHDALGAFGDLFYEYRKDVLTYVVIAGLFMLFTRRPPVAKPRQTEAFDIRDGASILRAPTADILAVRAAGNYVEFALADGRRPLMRASLAAVEAALAPAGFVRTHRSWLINPVCVRALAAAGSGDFRIDLGEGVVAPLSRRHRQALERLTAHSAPSV